MLRVGKFLQKKNNSYTQCKSTYDIYIMERSDTEMKLK